MFLAVLPAGIAGSDPYVAPETILQDDITYAIHWDDNYSFEESLVNKVAGSASKSSCVVSTLPA
jgi:hypothetical protein